MTAPTGTTADMLTRFITNTAASNGSSSSSSRPSSGSSGSSASWFEALSRAWGESLDKQASEIVSLSGNIKEGEDKPSDMIKLTAASQRMAFISQNAATSQNSTSEALSTLAKRN